jgi:thiamine transporter ThiT
MPHTAQNRQSGLQQFIDGLVNPKTLRRGLVICLAVGSLLTLINQWDNLTQHQMLYPWQALLTYLVPFIVSTFSSASASMQQEKTS